MFMWPINIFFLYGAYLVLCKKLASQRGSVQRKGKAKLKNKTKLKKITIGWDVRDLWSHLFFVPVPEPTMSLLGDSHIASARRSRRPSSLGSMDDMWRRPKFSGQLPHTSSKVTLRSKAPSTNKRDTVGTKLLPKLLFIALERKESFAFWGPGKVILAC